MEIASDLAPKRTHAALSGVLFAVVSIGAVAAIYALQLRGLQLAIPVLAWIAAYLFFIRQMNRKLIAAGCASPAMLRYNRRMGVIAIVYVASIIAAVWTAKTYMPSGPVAWLIALVPAVPVLAMVWTMMRLIVEERDEYLRARVIEQGMIATGFMLAAVTVYGFLESFGLVPHVPAYGAFIVWCAGLGVAGCWQRFRRS